MFLLNYEKCFQNVRNDKNLTKSKRTEKLNNVAGIFFHIGTVGSSIPVTTFTLVRFVPDKRAKY